MTYRAVCNLWIALAALASLGSAHGADLWQETVDRAEKLQEEQKPGDARTLLLSALVQASRHPRDEFRLAYTFNNLGSVAQDQGQFLDAEKFYRRSLAHWERSGERGPLGMARTLNNLASLMQSSGKLQEARRLLLRSRELEAGRQNPDSPDTAVMLVNLGTTYLSQRNYREAEALYQRAAAMMRRHPQFRAWEVGRISRDLGVICQNTGRKNEAASYFESARKAWEEHVAAGSTAPEMYLDLASLYSSLGQSAQALTILETAISQWDLPASPDTPAKVDLLELYAKLLRRSGRKTDAARVEAQARKANALSQASLVRRTVDVSELRRTEPSSRPR